VHFRTNKTDLAAKRYRTALVALVRQAGRMPGCSIEIEAHADQRGSRQHNLRLTRKRAAALRAMLRALGMEARIPVRISYHGKRRLLCATPESRCLFMNRRGIVTIVPAAAAR
jgi:peptidoglycan-associated lipoprotein